MYYYISGRLVKTDVNTAVVDNGGIGYLMNVSVNTLRHIEGKNEIQLFTYFNVREDAQELFGFYSEKELLSFKQLIAVSGIGPKAALSILSALTPDELSAAVAAGDIKAISTAQGVGKRMAERVVLELKDKLSADFASARSPQQPAAGSAAGNAAEAVNALVVLGYSRQEAARAVGSVETAGMEIDDIIKAALKMML